jgi:CubicO group peptidase (beta-lactamase class C family)
MVAYTGVSQGIETRIQNVENGLIPPIILLPTGGKITPKNILHKLKEYKVNGASVAVIHNGRLDWSKAYGFTNSKKTHPVTKETLFQSASIGKVITAMSVLLMVQDGLLDLDENVNNKLKRWKLEENKNTEKQKVTLRHLLSHTAGLHDDYGFLGYNPKNNIPTLLQILNNGSSTNAKKSLTVKSVPGKVERYSGGGYLIIQLLIEDVSGISFSDYVQKSILDPLKMSHTTYDYQPDKNMGRLIATGHRSNGKPLRKKKYHIYPEMAAAGPWTTAEDLSKLVISIQMAIKDGSHSIFDQKLINEFITPKINHRGLGINIRGIDKPLAFWHSGQNLGYTGLLYGLIEKGEGAIILLNSDGGEGLLKEFISSVANTYNWPVMKSYKSIPIPKNLASRLVGKYENSEKTTSLSIGLKKGKLFVKSSASKEYYQLYRIGENHYTFKNAQDYFRLTFMHENENVLSLNYAESIGTNIELKKVIITK